MWGLLPVFLILFFFWRGLPGAYHIRMAWYLLPKLIFANRRDGKLPWNWESVLTFRVYPDDLDWNLHMNNSSYNKLCDFARYSHLAVFFGRSVAGANGGVMMRFKKSLGPFERFELRTRIVGATSKWIFVEHRFMGSNGRCKACGLCKLCIFEEGRVVDPRPLLGIPEADQQCRAGELMLLAEPHYGRDLSEKEF
mmetsp:Transcript_36003/g.101365  ORF Transcript_36003/g.101365 Transcript_36003/m.101365 type:complete len:195 (+) Transcript_36003:104-688(+)